MTNDWFLFDAETGEFYGRAGTSVGCKRRVARAWGLRFDNVQAEALGGGLGLLLTPDRPCEECDDTGHGLVMPCGTCGGAPRAFFALPRDHPSIVVRTMLAPQGEPPT